VDLDSLSSYFDAYIQTFYHCVDGSEDHRAMLLFYHVPFSFTSNRGFSWLSSEQDVLLFIGNMVDRLRAAGYSSTETLLREFQLLNRFSAQCTYSFLRRRKDGGELERMTVRYLLVDTSQGTRVLTFSADEGDLLAIDS
jgi:hypothetical protein